MKLVTIILQNDAKDSRITQADLDKMASVAACYVNDYLFKYYGFNVFVTGRSDGTGPKDAWTCHLVKTLDDPDAIAYHTRNERGQPELYVGLGIIYDNGGSTMGKGMLTVLVGILHEIAEALFDAWCTGWNDYSDTEEVAEEIVDAVEGDTFDIQGCDVPNFVLPAWFDPNAPSGTQVDYLGSLDAPLTVHKDGYIELRAGGPSGTYRQIFGENVPQWKRDYKARFSRRARLRT